MIFFSLFIYFVGLMVFCFKCYHLLLMLLMMEFIILSLYMGLYFFLSYYFYNYYFVMVFFIFMVCESVIGLCLLVLMVRFYGNDYFRSFSFLW